MTKNRVKIINPGKEGQYGKSFMKYKFDVDDNFPLNKRLKLRMLTIIVRSIFQEGKKLYSQIYLDERLCEL